MRIFVTKFERDMDYLSLIKKPIYSELEDFTKLFNQSLSHDSGLLSQALEHITYSEEFRRYNTGIAECCRRFRVAPHGESCARRCGR